MSGFRLGLLVLFGWSWISLTQPASASNEWLGYQPFSTRLGVGTTLGPNTALLVANVEGHVDSFLSFGPTFQAGLGSSKRLYLTTLGGRLTLPLHALERVKVSIHSGAGVIVRRVGGFHFTDFAFSTGLNLDVFVVQNLALGLGGILNITGNANERTIHSWMGMASYHF